MVSNISFSGVSSSLRTNEDSKDKILYTMQIAVKEIQCYCSISDPENGLSARKREVHQLCDSLDKTLFHGLKEYQKGYWPFVKDFTHSNIVSYIEGLCQSPTEIQCGRLWLCLALNENSLESYFRSFHQNPNLVQKHYSPPALLRDEQRMQLVLMLMAGLENIPVNLDLEHTNCGSGLSFFGDYVYKGSERSYSSCSGDIPMFEYSKPESETSSFRDSDSGIIGCENAVDTVDDGNLITNSEKNSEEEEINDIKVHEPVIVTPCQVAVVDFERITKYVNLSPESEENSHSDLQVTRTKVVRRFKKPRSQKNSPLPEVKKRISCPENLSKPDSTENFVDYRLSKATTDSGLSLETQSSSDRDSPELTYEVFNQNIPSFSVDMFHQDIAIKFSTPIKQSNEIDCTDMIFKPIEERGVPEGREDPIQNPCSVHPSSRLPLSSGNDGLDINEDDEEISIYDIGKLDKLGLKDKHKNDEDEDIISEISSSICSTIHATPDHCFKIVEKTPYKDPVDDELIEILKEKDKDNEVLDIRLDNSTLLYLLVEIFEHEKENYYKMFYCYLHFVKGNDRLYLLLLTNKCLYILEPGNSEQKFIFHDSIAYSNIDLITVYLNYQGFVIRSRNFKQNLEFYTAHEDLTRCIISNLEVAMRRIPKLPLPSFCTNGLLQISQLQKFFASLLNCLKNDIIIYHYVLAFWEDYDGTSSPNTPTGPKREGVLMYRHRFVQDGAMTAWQPGHFVLNGSVLYCMEEGYMEPLFYIQMWTPHCKGCRRLHPPVRPYSFELILSNGDALQLAAADEQGASEWQQAFLQTVSLAGKLIDCSSGAPTPCSIILFNDYVAILKELRERKLPKCIGIANICDIVAVYTHSSMSSCIYMEFEITEADKSCGEWILVFDTEHEKEKFVDALKWRWSSLFQTDLKVSSLKDLSLVKKIQQIAHNNETDKLRLHHFCHES